MDGDQSIEMSVPLDEDGFLRRECPTCEREFKWFNSPEGQGEPLPMGGYYCPYCRVQGPPDAWWTKEQLEHAENRVARDIVGPEFERMARDLKRSSRNSLIRIDITHETPPELDPLVEPNDMRRVDFPCHPTEPLKVLDDWTRPVHCMICSQPSS
jgi:hypothetical protein